VTVQFAQLVLKLPNAILLIKNVLTKFVYLVNLAPLMQNVQTALENIAHREFFVLHKLALLLQIAQEHIFAKTICAPHVTSQTINATPITLAKMIPYVGLMFAP
jgi:hypothetical protein